MAYVKQEWKGYPDTSTPITADKLNHMEDGIYSSGVPDGGTTGQVLAKKSDANNDVEWVDQTGGSADYDSLPVGSVIDYYGDTVPTGYEEVKDTQILWTNQSPTSNFATQTITLSSNDYDILEIYYSMASNNTYVGSQKFIKGSNTRIMYNTSALNIRFRNIIYLSDKSYSISSGTGDGGSDADLIPLYIVGYKTGLFS